ncbi:MAG TPA: hypothetical protein VEC11_06270 [Allosphingosinicella sp.]|nr:hypothetical protein [Allosphingosinicella sp.]
MTETEQARADRAAGIALTGAAGLGMLAMAHHPSSLHAGALVGIVHGAMILFAAMLAFGFTHYARRRGLGRPAVLAGLVAFAIGTFASIGAAIVNGFAAPALAAEGAGHDALHILWAVNQALARLGVVAVGAAYLCWSLDLWRQSKPVALLGLLAGGVPALLLAGGWIGMHLHAAILVYGAQFLWAILVGWLLLRGDFRDEGPSGD